jgi:hypothetical protein
MQMNGRRSSSSEKTLAPAVSPAKCRRCVPLQLTRSHPVSEHSVVGSSPGIEKFHREQT